MASKPVIIAITSDHHAGSTVSLCPQTISLDDGGYYGASEAQRWLWANWGDFWHAVRERVAHRKGTKLIQVFNGDLTEGDHHKSTQILSGNPTAQAAVVNEVMRVPLALKPDALCFVRGTEAHVGSSACFEERIAEGLSKDKRPVIREAGTNNASHWNATMEIQGVRLDFAHHGKFGSRPSTKMNVINALAADIFTEHHMEGRQHPHIAVRSHMHQYADTFNAYPTRLIQTPAWQLKTAFVHRISTTGKLSHIGGVVITIDGGEYEVEPIIYRPDPPKAWSLE